jgi:hypothetical protein
LIQYDLLVRWEYVILVIRFILFIIFAFVIHSLLLAFLIFIFFDFLYQLTLSMNNFSLSFHFHYLLSSLHYPPKSHMAYKLTPLLNTSVNYIHYVYNSFSDMHDMAIPIHSQVPFNFFRNYQLFLVI